MKAYARKPLFRFGRGGCRDRLWCLFRLAFVDESCRQNQSSGSLSRQSHTRRPERAKIISQIVFDQQVAVSHPKTNLPTGRAPSLGYIQSWRAPALWRW